MPDRGPSSEDAKGWNDLNMFDKDTCNEDKFDLQKKLGDIALKKQQEEIIMLSRETVRLIRVSTFPHKYIYRRKYICWART